MWKSVLLMILITMFGCTKEQSDTRNADITFEVDQALLSAAEIYPDLGFSFQPPLNWDKINAEMQELIKNKVLTSQDTDQVYFLPKNVFMNMEKTFTCFLSTLESDLLPDDAKDSYLTDFREINQNSKLIEGSFSHNSLDFHQIIFESEDFMAIKLIVQANDEKAFMIDYVVPAQNYKEELRSIESSIGTIKKTREKIL